MSHCKMDGGGMHCTEADDCGCECSDCRETRQDTYVEGREAPSQAAVDDLVRAHADRGSKVNVHDIVPRETGGREAPMEACEMPASSGGAAWAATVEACARAAYAVGRKHWAGDPHWEHLPRVTIEHWRDVARAVLAAAGLPAKGAGR